MFHPDEIRAPGTVVHMAIEEGVEPEAAAGDGGERRPGQIEPTTTVALRQGCYQRVEARAGSTEIEHVAHRGLEIEAAIIAEQAEQGVRPRPLLLEGVPGHVVRPWISNQSECRQMRMGGRHQAPGEVIADFAGARKESLEKFIHEAAARLVQMQEYE